MSLVFLSQVALIENHLMGGDCLNVGCVPSKALISAARVAHTVRNSEAYGVEVTGYVAVNFGKVKFVLPVFNPRATWYKNRYKVAL